MTEIASGEIPNPPEMRFVKLAIGVVIVFVCMVLVAYVISEVTLLLFVGWVLPAIPVLTIWYREYYRRTTAVKIEHGGVRFRFRFKAGEFIRWEQIGGIHRERGDLSTSRGRRARTGGLMVKGRSFPYPMTYEVASALCSAYVEQTGTTSPVWGGTH